MTKNINMEKTIDRFFESVWKYADKVSAMYSGPEDKAVIEDQKQVLKKLEADVKRLPKINDLHEKYIATTDFRGRDYSNMDKLFYKPSKNPKGEAYKAFVNVCLGIADYYQSEYSNPDVALAPMKQWYYTTATNKLKDFVYPFIPLSRFAEKDK
ncbi:MAG: hypothetical protein J5608_00305 [Alphaproteobacteria bacterium]|nr:hypothetical protein [Alphaproteobacteria bacterium]